MFPPDSRTLARVIDKKKKNPWNYGLCCPGRPQSKDKKKRKERQVLGPCQRTRKAVEVVIGVLETIPKSLVRRLELEIAG